MKSFALVSLFIVSVTSYSAGPPDFVCDDPFLKPKHDGNDFQTSPSPFELTVVPGNNFYSIQITSTGEIPFKGYIIQAQYTEGNDAGFPVGDFMEEFIEDTDEEKHKRFNCETEESIGNTISHNKPGQHEQVTAIWFPPQDLPLQTNIAFKATVVKVKPEFWSIETVLTVVSTKIISCLLISTNITPPV